MENQTIREELFDVLFSYVKEYDGIYTESDCAAVRDEICLRIDQSQLTADEAEERINQEVERRIKEMMSDNEINAIAVKFAPPMMYYGVTGGEDVNLFIRRDVIEILVNLRSRLTPQEKKSEGGGEG